MLRKFTHLRRKKPPILRNSVHHDYPRRAGSSVHNQFAKNAVTIHDFGLSLRNDPTAKDIAAKSGARMQHKAEYVSMPLIDVV